MDIRGPEGIGRTPGVNKARKASQAYQAADASASRAPDEVQLSEKAQLLSKLSAVPDVRWEKVLEVKNQIEKGAYETTEKLEQAVDKLLQELYGEQAE